MGDTSSLRVRPSHGADFGGEELLRPGELYRLQVRQVRLASPTSGASLMRVCTMGRWARQIALLRACALVYWCHGPLFADARSRREGPRSGSGEGAHVRLLQLTENHRVVRFRSTLRERGRRKVGWASLTFLGSAVGVNGSPLAWVVGGREVGLFWLLGGSVGGRPVSP